MAYVDTRNTSRNFGAGIAVLAVEVGIGLALVAGLSGTLTREKDNPFIAHTFTPDPPKVPPAPPKTKPTEDSVIDRVDRMIEVPPTTGGPVIPEGPLTDSGGETVVGPLTPPDTTPPPPPEPPRFTPKRAAPKNKTALWVTTNDYPTNDLRAEHHGRTGYRLLIDSKGTVTDCTVTATSGFPGLDKAACDNVRRRARFEPATDETGARTAGSYSGSVTWTIPKE